MRVTFSFFVFFFNPGEYFFLGTLVIGDSLFPLVDTLLYRLLKPFLVLLCLSSSQYFHIILWKLIMIIIITAKAVSLKGFSLFMFFGNEPVILEFLNAFKANVQI